MMLHIDQRNHRAFKANIIHHSIVRICKIDIMQIGRPRRGKNLLTFRANYARYLSPLRRYKIPLARFARLDGQTIFHRLTLRELCTRCAERSSKRNCVTRMLEVIVIYYVSTFFFRTNALDTTDF